MPSRNCRWRGRTSSSTLRQPERHEEQAGLVDVPVVAVNDMDLRLVHVETAAQPVGDDRAAGPAAENHDLFPDHLVASVVYSQTLRRGPERHGHRHGIACGQLLS